MKHFDFEGAEQEDRYRLSALTLTYYGEVFKLPSHFCIAPKIFECKGKRSKFFLPFTQQRTNFPRITTPSPKNFAFFDEVFPL